MTTVGILNALYLKGKRVVTDAKPITIVTYHSISEQRDHYTISPVTFSRHIDCIANNYDVMRLGCIEEALCNRDSRAVILTFDDAYVDFLKVAYPVLRARAIPCTVFVPSGLIGQQNIWDSRLPGYVAKRILTAAQLKGLHREGLVEFGSHSVDHSSMARLPMGDIRKQAKESKRTLEHILGRRITMFSYPYGHFSAATTRVLAETNYKIGVTTKWGTLNSAHDLLCLKRISLSEEDADTDILAKINGHHDIYYVKGVGARLRSALSPSKSAFH